jgi:hypothetical protein
MLLLICYSLYKWKTWTWDYLDSGEQPTITEARIVLLGTRSPVADPERSGPALAVVAAGKP